MMNREKIRIGKEFIWQMSHRLPFHKGACQNIHGHSYSMRVELEGETDSNGMIIDYYDVESIVAPLVAQMDHSFCVDDNDSIMLEFLKKNNFKHYIVPFTTTAENLTKHILEIIKPKFRNFSNLKKIKVRVNETADVFAELEEEL
jgi:6-pyruvoyltetrahydropterin/6-carboxytetrahydropterin synthase